MREEGVPVKLFSIAAALVLLCAVIGAVMHPWGAPREDVALIQCRENLRRIGEGMRVYLRDSGGKLPLSETVENPHPELVGAFVSKYVADMSDFYCPAATKPSATMSAEDFKKGEIGYFYYNAVAASGDESLSRFLRTGVEWPRELDGKSDPKSWVMSDMWFSGDPTAHAGYKKGVNFLMLDGSVGFVAESPRQAFH